MNFMFCCIDVNYVRNPKQEVNIFGIREKESRAGVRISFDENIVQLSYHFQNIVKISFVKIWKISHDKYL